MECARLACANWLRVYHGVKVAAHLQEALQRLHHLLLAQGVQPGALALLQVPDGGLQGHRSALEDAHSWITPPAQPALLTQGTSTAALANGSSPIICFGIE